MKFIVSNSELRNNLCALLPVVNSNSALPIFAHILFEIHDGVLVLTASDSDNMLSTELKLADYSEDAVFSICASDIVTTAKNIGDQPLSCEVCLEKKLIDITYQNGKITLPVSDDVYPKMNGVDATAKTYEVPSGELKSAIARSLIAVANDPIRPIMNGILFDFYTDNLSLVASDGHVLVRTKLYSAKAEEHASFNLPKTPATILKNNIDATHERVALSFNERMAELRFGTFTLRCRLIEGRYPNYNAVIPTSFKHILTVNRKDFIAAIKRTRPCADTKSNPTVKLTINNNLLTLETQDIDFSKAAKESVLCQYEDNEFQIAFNSNKLLDTLNCITDECVRMQLNESSTPGIMTSTEQKDGEDVIFLNMPMLIS